MTFIFFMTENWRPIKNFPGYWISDQGRIKSKKRKNEVLKKSFPSKLGFLQTFLYQEDKLTTVYVARLVLEAFVGYPADPWLCIASYKNGDITDCRLENLEWLVCETTAEYDPSKSHRKGVLKPKETRERMSDSKRKQSPETISKIQEARRRTMESKKKVAEEKQSRSISSLKERLKLGFEILTKYGKDKGRKA